MQMCIDSGIDYFTEMYNWCGFALCSALAVDLMHCEIKGKFQKNFTLYKCSVSARTAYLFDYAVFLIQLRLAQLT
jgi:hypothetical protein